MESRDEKILKYAYIKKRDKEKGRINEYVAQKVKSTSSTVSDRRKQLQRMSSISIANSFNNCWTSVGITIFHSVPQIKELLIKIHPHIGALPFNFTSELSHIMHTLNHASQHIDIKEMMHHMKDLISDYSLNDMDDPLLFFSNILWKMAHFFDYFDEFDDDQKKNPAHHFWGKQIKCFQCIKCGHTTKHEDRITQIKLAYKDHDQSLCEMLSPTTEKVNDRYCAYCNQKHKGILHISTSMMDFIVFSLDIYDNDRNKMQGRIVFEEFMQLNKDDNHVNSNDDKKVAPDVVRLCTVVIKNGDVDGGHYWSYSRSGETWYYNNDKTSRRVSTYEVLDANARCDVYALVYARPIAVFVPSFDADKLNTYKEILMKKQQSLVSDVDDTKQEYGDHGDYSDTEEEHESSSEYVPDRQPSEPTKKKQTKHKSTTKKQKKKQKKQTTFTNDDLKCLQQEYNGASKKIKFISDKYTKKELQDMSAALHSLNTYDFKHKRQQTWTKKKWVEFFISKYLQ
eukprot:127979_1